MKLTFRGKVSFANGAPLAGVTVRVFDQDAEHKQDDDLTITPGLSDEQGRFSVIYDPGRYLDMVRLNTSGTASQPFNSGGLRLPDMTDLYLPYLRFDYGFLGQARQHRAWLVPFQSEFHLPENLPVQFMPSEHGFRFPNRFAGYFLPFSTPVKLKHKKVPPTYGLCGGMSSAALDYRLAGRPVPETSDVPRGGTRLQRYLFNRQMDTMGGLGSSIIRVAQWTTLPDDTPLGVQRLSAVEFTSLRQRLDDQNPVVLALIYVHAKNASELGRVIFNNHQVLAYAYEQHSSGDVIVRVYDPNYPERDDVVLRVRQTVVSTPAGGEPVAGVESLQLAGTKIKQVRGFFTMPYTPVEPPDKV